MDEIVIYSSQIFDSHFAKRKEDMNQFCKGSREKSLIMVRLHSGLPGGGLRFSGKIFRVPFFGFFGFPTCQMIRKKYSNIRGKPFPV